MGSAQSDLHDAVFRGDVQAASRAIALGADVNCRPDGGRYPIEWAAIYGDPELLEVLFQAGASKDIFDQNGNNLLHLCHKAPAVATLIKHGADVNAEGSDGNSPLHVVRSVECAELLIASKAGVNDVNDKGQTPLHTCIMRGMIRDPDIAVVKLLVDNGADLNAVDKDGRRPLDCFLAPENREFFAKLISAAQQPIDSAGKQDAQSIAASAPTPTAAQ